MRWFVVLVMAATTLFPCSISGTWAQDLSLFNPDDYISPYDLASALLVEPRDKPFVVATRFQVGYAWDYQDREIFTDEILSFAGVSLAAFRGRKQVNAKLGT